MAEAKKPEGGFFYKNTVEVKFPDGTVHRVNKFEAKALEEKLKSAKFQKLLGGKVDKK